MESSAVASVAADSVALAKSAAAATASPGSPRSANLPHEPLAGLKIVSFNVWFDGFAQEQRNAALLSELERCEPDVIGLQEVTPSSLGRVLSSPWVRQHFMVSDALGFTVVPYGVLLLCRRSLPIGLPDQLFDVELPSNMARRALFARWTRQSLVFGTVHLESLSNKPTRRAQLDIMGAVVRDDDHAVLTGDWNFDDRHNYLLPVGAQADGLLEERNVGDMLEEFVDCWPAVHGPGSTAADDDDREARDAMGAGGFPHCKTFDRQRNPMFDRGDERARYDRICVKSPALRPTAIEMIGQLAVGRYKPGGPFTWFAEPEARLAGPCDPDDGGGRYVVPSDHFGLFAQWSRPSS